MDCLGRAVATFAFGGDVEDDMTAVETIMQAEITRLRDQLHLAEVARAAQVEGLTQSAAGWRERSEELAAQVADYQDASLKLAETAVGFAERVSAVLSPEDVATVAMLRAVVDAARKGEA
jgi:hypothetical protein